MAVIQLTSDTLSIENQRANGRGGAIGDFSGSDGDGGDFSLEGEQVVRCDISVKGFHLQVYHSITHSEHLN